MALDHENERLADWLVRHRTRAGTVVGVSGSQGSGKSTRVAVLQRLLRERHGQRAAVVALDNFYRTRAERGRLAATVHPLLATRGVPGTHDVGLAARLLDRLVALRPGERVRLPRFDKVRDDRADAAGPEVEGPVDLVLFEGWCVGTPAQTDAELATPVNALEATEDADGRWRRYVNDQLAGDYRRLFERLGPLVFLAAPDFETVFRWRAQQERGNVREAGVGTSSLTDPARLRRFIDHYERLTRHALRVMPEYADVVLELGPGHEVSRARYRSP